MNFQMKQNLSSEMEHWKDFFKKTNQNSNFFHDKIVYIVKR